MGSGYFLTKIAKYVTFRKTQLKGFYYGDDEYITPGSDEKMG